MGKLFVLKTDALRIGNIGDILIFLIENRDDTDKMFNASYGKIMNLYRFEYDDLNA